jgi:PAS domain S-box-containing protein
MSEPGSNHRRRAPLRFVWQMDAEHRFTVGSDEFAALMGQATAAALGRPWPELTAALSLDPEGQVALALASRDTWSGLCIAWPADDGCERLMVELSGLPVFDRERVFRGYRGFGICRDLARLATLDGARKAATVGPASGSQAEATSAAEAASAVEPALAAKNVVPLRPTSQPVAPALSPVERSAFHELTRKLHERLTGAGSPAPFGATDALRSSLAQAAQQAQAEAQVAAQEAVQAEHELPTPHPIRLSAGSSGAALARAQAEILELKAIVDTAADGVVLIDRQGHILSSNARAQALFGYEARALAGRAFVELLAPESAPIASDTLGRLLRGDAGRARDGGGAVIGRNHAGRPLALFMTLGRIGDGGEKLCAVFRDLTSGKKEDDAIGAARRQSEKIAAAKSDFLAVISDLVRTPLHAIIGFAEIMVQEKLGPVGNERYRQYIGDIHGSGEHLLSVVNDLLDLSKIEAGRLALDFTGVALNPLTQQCVAILQPQANRERIIIRSSLPPRLPPVLADARSLRQIVLNVISHSTRRAGAGGQVIVSTTLTDLGEVVLRVRDSGAGMSAAEIALALEPFRQIATTTLPGAALAGAALGSPAGSGLGLPLTKALAEANHAALRITSTPNAGTLIEVAFPPERLATQVRP